MALREGRCANQCMFYQMQIWPKGERGPKAEMSLSHRDRLHLVLDGKCRSCFGVMVWEHRNLGGNSERLPGGELAFIGNDKNDRISSFVVPRGVSFVGGNLYLKVTLPFHMAVARNALIRVAAEQPANRLSL